MQNLSNDLSDFQLGLNEGRFDISQDRPLPLSTVIHLRHQYPHGFASQEFWDGYAAALRTQEPVQGAKNPDMSEPVRGLLTFSWLGGIALLGALLGWMWGCL